MALGVTPVFQGQNLYIADCVFANDADTTGNVPHGLGLVPLHVVITPTNMIAATVPMAATTIDATNVALTKVGVGAGSAAASPVRVMISRPHSIIR
jgi:hypothetical protein